MIRKVDHMVITTENITSLIAFYEAIGFSAKSANGRYELYSGDFKINVHIKGKELTPNAKNIQPGSGDFCFEVDDDLTVLKEKLTKIGVLTELGVTNRHGARGEMASLYLRDPDGNLIELCSYE
ncbi:MAG: VOC family protein [Clostridia bacterium]